MIKNIIIIMFLLQSIIIFGKTYDYSSNIYQEYLTKAYSCKSKSMLYSVKTLRLCYTEATYVINKLYYFNKDLLLFNKFKIKLKNNKKIKLQKAIHYPLLNLLYQYDKIKRNKERYNFIMNIKQAIIKDYFELKYYQRIDNQIEFQKKLKSLNKFDIFLTLPFLIEELKADNYLAYQKLIKEIYNKNKNNIALLLYYEDDFIENGLNTDLIDNYFLNNKFHIDRLIEKFKKLEYKTAIKKILKLVNLHPKSVRIFSQIITWNEFFRNTKGFVDIIKLYPFTKKNPYLLYQITKLSIGELLKKPITLLKIKIPEAQNLYKLLSSKEKTYSNHFFSKELNSLSQKELNNENKILKITKKISLNNKMAYTIEQKEAIYFANTNIKNLFYEILYIEDEEILEINDSYIYRDDGEIIKINDYDLVIPYEYDGLYSDMKILRFNLKAQLQKGDIFYIHYKIKSTKKRNYFKNKISILENIKPKSDIVSYKYSIKYPKNLKLKIAFNKDYLKKTVSKSKENDYETITFSGENLKQFINEEYYYFSYKEEPYISISNFSNWKDVKSWFQNIIFDKNYRLSSKNIKYFKKLIEDKQLENKEDIIKFFYAYILDNIHYVGIELGIHSYKPYSPNAVFENKYGDCKDRALLFLNILKIFNVDIKIVLVSTNDFGLYNFNIPSYSYFNHAIVYIPKFNKFLDLTNKTTPYSYLPKTDINSKILILNSKKGIESLKIKENNLIKKDFIYNNKNNDLEIKQSEYYYGSSINDNLHIDFKELNTLVYEKYINQYYNNIVKLISYIVQIKRRPKYQKAEFNYTIKNKVKDKITIIKLFQNNDLFENRFTPSFNRVNSFYFNTDINYEYSFKFNNLKNIYSFEDKIIENTFFNTSLKINKNIIKFKFKMKVKYIPAEENKSFKKKLKELDDLLQKKYYLEFK